MTSPIAEIGGGKVIDVRGNLAGNMAQLDNARLQ
jgi:hypothetical protein